MDRITLSLLNEFTKKFEIKERDSTILFENFINFCVAYRESAIEDIELECITTGDNTQGIDGIIIIVNRKIVNSVNEIEELIKINRLINVKFIFIQSKTSDNFSSSDISAFISFIDIFFSDNTAIFTTDEMKKFIEMKEYIFSNAPKLEKNPELSMYYVTTGVFQSDKNIDSVVDAGINKLKKLNLFTKILFFRHGATEVQTMYRKTYSDLETTFYFDKKVTMYSNNEEDMGFCGVLPFKEYKKIVMDENGNILPVFEDNIRDFLGPTIEVNEAIKDTIKNGDTNAFSMLNNGIVIVSNSAKHSGDIMTLTNYQVVNGCQTSHMLIQNIESRKDIDNFMIPVRIIVTKDEELKIQITKATNNQTGVKKEQLDILSNFHKKLEEYYKTYQNDDERLFYERRTGQYRNANIPKTKIITIQNQIKTVAAMFLNNPHGVSGQYGTIAKNVGNKLFKNDDQLIIYYTSALALYRIEYFLKSNIIDKKYWKTRYHAIMLFRIVVDGEMPKRFNLKKMNNYCEKIIKVLNTEEKCIKLFKGIVSFISIQQTINLNDRKTFERKETTDELLKKIKELIVYLKDNNSISNDIQSA